MTAYNAVLGDYPETAAIKSGASTLPRAELAFTEYPRPYHGAFKPMVNQQAYDISEMAIVTLLIAKCYGRPLHLVPAVMLGRLQHRYASVRDGLDLPSPRALSGLRIGMRSFTQTTVTWLRGILQVDEQADVSGVTWIKFEEPHVPEAADPSMMAPEGKTLDGMLLEGEIDVALGVEAKAGRTRPLFADPEAAGRAWLQRHGCVPVNHMVCVTEDMVANHLDDVVDLWTLLREGKAAVPWTGSGPDPKPLGFEANRPAVDLVIRYMTELGMLPRPITYDDLIDPRIREAIGG